MIVITGQELCRPVPILRGVAKLVPTSIAGPAKGAGLFCGKGPFSLPNPRKRAKQEDSNFDYAF